MKKHLLVFFFIFNSLLQVSAKEADLFSYDKAAVASSLSELSVLESYMNEHPALAIVKLTDSGDVMINGIKLSVNFIDTDSVSPMGIPSFLWGCTFGVVGVILVYMLTNNDREQVHKALVGCIVSYSIIAVFYIVYIVLFINDVNHSSNGNVTYYTY